MNDSTHIPARRKPRSRAKLAVIAVAGAALIGFGAWKVLHNGDDEDEYFTAPVTMGDIEDLVTATGTLEPRDYVDVGAQVSGQIKKIYVEVGDVVKAGDVLAEIDAEQAEARVQSNRAQLKSSETSLLTQKNNLEKAERDFKRQQNLWAENATTEEALKNAETSLINAQNQIVQSEAQIAQQKANMRIEERNLQYTKIEAPIAGTVMSIAVKEGQSVNASQSVPVVLRLADLGTMTVRADVSEADISRLYDGMSVYFTTLGAGQNRRWYSELKRKEPTPKTQQGVILYPALFDVQNEVTSQGAALMPQMTTQVFFIAAQARNVLTVPMAALQQGQQIMREMAAKEREASGATPQAGGFPRPEAAVAAPEGAPASAAAAGSASSTGTVADASGPGEGERPGRQGAGNGQRPGGNFGGQRPGGGGFDPSQMTPEMLEQIRAARAARGGNGGPPGGFGGFGGGFGGGMGMAGNGNTRQPQQRRGTVMVQLADGTLEPRQVVIGVTNRVHGEVLEGLKEGENVVVGKRETEAAASAAASSNNNNNNFRPQGGFPGGGRPF